MFLPTVDWGLHRFIHSICFFRNPLSKEVWKLVHALKVWQFASFLSAWVLHIDLSPTFLNYGFGRLAHPSNYHIFIT
uniref:Uncharacterized protein n=1 Tax=Rhizophora mucronata TaxID=61149 RepID=A0A2P2NQV6_RHIMU